jgi:hypothetical protein
MKSIVLGSLIAVVASQAAGCIITSDNNDAFLSATWTLKNTNSTSSAPCPPGFDTAALYSQEVDANNNPIGSPIIDLFTCNDGAGTSSALPPSVYQVWVDITNSDNTSKFASSLSAIVDLSVSDKTFSTQILIDGGYFDMAWNLIGASSGNPLSCGQAGATGGVEAVSTNVANMSTFTSDIFTCEDHEGVTSGLVAATYTVDVQALNGSMAAISTTPTLMTKVIGPKNAVTDLGTISIPVTGM